MTFSALDMPFPDSSVSGIFMVDTFHHLPDAGLFLSEASRVLKENGKLVMIEPANSIWGRFIFQQFHHELFDPGGTWQIPGDGPLSQANACLPWIVFERDRAHFNREFPHLAVEKIHYHTPLRYLLSGGVSFKQFVPDLSFPFFRAADRILAFLSKQTCMFVTLKIIKTKAG
ncbi:MAG: class I SAM-dependent methyltransferase [Bacteroidota bacterium]